MRGKNITAADLKRAVDRAFLAGKAAGIKEEQDRREAVRERARKVAQGGRPRSPHLTAGPG